MVSREWGRLHCKHNLVGGLQTVLQNWRGSGSPRRTQLGPPLDPSRKWKGAPDPKRLCRGTPRGVFKCGLPPPRSGRNPHHSKYVVYFSTCSHSAY